MPPAVTVHRPTNSPSGTPGTVLYPKSPRADSPLDWGYNAGHQTWGKVSVVSGPLSVAGEDEVSIWLGYETAHPPTPEALERAQVLPGYRCFDKLDQVWHIPVARSPRGSASVPSEFRRTRTGIERIPDPRYLGLWDLSGVVYDWLHDVFQPAHQDLWKYDTAVQLLQVNYRVGPDELNLLQSMDRSVLTSETIDPILCAVVDNDLPQQLRDYLAKKNGVNE